MGNVYKVILNLRLKEETSRLLPYNRHVFYIQANDSDEACELAKEIAFAVDTRYTKKYNKDKSDVFSCELAEKDIISREDYPERKHLYDKFEHYNQAYNLFEKDIEEKIYPVIKEWSDNGYSEVDLIQAMSDHLRFLMAIDKEANNAKIVTIYSREDLEKMARIKDNEEDSKNV